MSIEIHRSECAVHSTKVLLRANPLRIGISTRALFALEEEHRTYLDDGLLDYVAMQQRRETTPLGKGVAFEVISRLLALNEPGATPYVEVILLSRNAPDLSLRAFNAIETYGLDIKHASFTSGRSLAPFVPAWGVDLFLSNDGVDVAAAALAGAAAAKLGTAPERWSSDDDEVRIAFDGDCVLFSKESNEIYEREGLTAFMQHEFENATRPMRPGPFGGVLKKIVALRSIHTTDGVSKVRIGIVTARSAPAHARVIHTLRAWGTTADEVHFVGDREKAPVLASYGAHIFFDDQKRHVLSASHAVATGHVPSL